VKLKRYKYSLRNCNPSKRLKRKEVNELDFQKVFPFYSFDKDKINLNLVRRFLYQNKIPYYYLYSEELIEKQDKERKNLSVKEKEFIATEDEPVYNRFEILDIR